MIISRKDDNHMKIFLVTAGLINDLRNPKLKEGRNHLFQLIGRIVNFILVFEDLRKTNWQKQTAFTKFEYLFITSSLNYIQNLDIMILLS